VGLVAELLEPLAYVVDLLLRGSLLHRNNHCRLPVPAPSSIRAV
jgi:hypothetical protein